MDIMVVISLKGESYNFDVFGTPYHSGLSLWLTPVVLDIGFFALVL